MAVVSDEASEKLTLRFGLQAVVDGACASHRRAAGLLVLACLLAFLPGFFGIPPVDRDESRFAQATKQMLETGNFVDIRFQDEARYKKPVGIYWLQAATVALGNAVGVPRAHTRIWLYRFPSLLGAIGAVLATYWAALAFVTRRGALLAGLMMASSILLGFEARLATTDAVLLLTIVAAMGALGRIYLEGQGIGREAYHPWRRPAIFWTALAAGILLKGPLILMFVGLAALALTVVDRSAAWLMRLKPLPGIAWMLLLVLPWFIAIVAKSGDQFFADSVGHDLLAKVVGAQESHGAPPGAYFVLFWVTFFPGAMLAALAAPAVWRERKEPGARFLIAWVVPAWIVLEIVVTKLPHYVLPVYPAIAILIAGAVENKALAPQRWLRTGPAWWFILTIGFGVLAIVLHIKLAAEPGALAWPFIVAALLVALFAWRLFEVDGAELSLLRAVAAAILVSWALFGATLAWIPQLFPAQDLAKYVRFNAKCDVPQVATAGYHEPSLVFLAGTGLKHTDGAGAAEFLKPGGCRFAFVEARDERSFALRADALGVRYAKGMRVEGINVSGGQPIAVTVYRAVP
ncbi:MAG TPA: glycosyltransferase family 39 protein [Xanthobacteraceae bacterium]|nr:glycosyltransferase family 39 protein [Xanthobacteraceae bacterium]